MIHEKLCIFRYEMLENLDFPIGNNVNGLVSKSQNKQYKLPYNHTQSHWICLDIIMKNIIAWLYRIFFHSNLTDILFPTPTGCSFSWVVSTTYQVAMALF